MANTALNQITLPDGITRYFEDTEARTDMAGATATTDGVHGQVPAPSAGDNEKFLSGDGTWKSAGEYITKEASGNPIEISDGASAPLVKCVTAIQGNQDLHGYDKPWVGGAGKNKYTTKYGGRTQGGITYTVTDGIISIQGTAGSNNSWAVSEGSITADQCINFPAGTYTLNATGLDYVRYYFRDFNGGTALGYATKTEAFTVTLEQDTLVYVNVRIGYGYSNNTDVRLNIQIESGSSETSYEPYSNICPITAYNQSTISVGGKNLLKPYVYSNTYNGITASYKSDGSIEISGTASGTFDQPWSSWASDNNVYITLKPGTYKPFVTGNISGVRIQIVSSTNESLSTGESFTITKSTSVFARIQVQRNTVIPSGTVLYMQIERGNTPHDYEEYIAPIDHTATFSSAIYRGSEDVVNGEVECEKEKTSYTSSDVSITSMSYTGVTYFQIPKKTDSASYNSYYSEPIICSHAVNGNGTSLNNGVGYIRSDANKYNYVIGLPEGTTEAQAKAILDGMELAYELATPTTSSITPTNLPIKSLFGYNHIESSTGDMEIEYITGEYQPLVDLIESNKHVYSTTEQIVGTWIDGSTIYEKTIMRNNTTWGGTLDTGISNMKDLIYAEWCMTGNLNVVPSVTNTGSFIRCQHDGNGILTMQGGTFDADSGRTWYLTIRYTKSTT